MKNCEISSVGRALASQAEGREFETRIWNEDWSVFPEDTNYSASNLGRIKNNKTGKILSGHITYSKTTPYIYIKCHPSGKSVGAHYMVLASFIPKPKGVWVCDHINHNTLDNRLENLRWLSVRDNIMNSDYRTIYGFYNGEYVRNFKGWKEVGEFTGLNPKTASGRARTKIINGWRFMTIKAFRKKSGYNRFVILNCD